MMIRYVMFTHPGLRHSNNQDAVLITDKVYQKAGGRHGTLTPPCRLAISDGAGGLPSASRVSRWLLKSLRDLDRTRPAWSPRQRNEALQSRLVRYLNRYPDMEDAGATLVTIEIGSERSWLWHVGDSRAYRIIHGRAEPLTQDQTLGHRLRQEGELEAESIGTSIFLDAVDELYICSPYAEPPSPDLTALELDPGAVYLLASDGLNRHLYDVAIAQAVDSSDLSQNMVRLWVQIRQAGAADNVSLILFRTLCKPHPHDKAEREKMR